MINIGSIYDAGTVQVYRRNPTQAVIVLDGTSVILRPWAWEASHPDDGPVPAKVEAGLEKLFGARSQWGARTTLGSLFLWASRRPPRGEFAPSSGEDGDVLGYVHRLSSDPQSAVDGRIFDRLLIREVLQTHAEVSTPSGAHVVLGIVEPYNGLYALTISCAGIIAGVMGRNGGDVGTDAMPVQWHGNPFTDDSHPPTTEGT